MIKKLIVTIACLLVILVASYFNCKYEIIAINPFVGEKKGELKVMTWNVHCSEGTDNDRQRRIAEFILKENADFVQLNEYNQDSCLVIDSLLSKYYSYKNGKNAKVRAGDIFYSKKDIVESGKYREVNNCIFSKLFIGKDSLFIIGCHMPGNNHEGQIEIDDADSLQMVKTFWGYYRNAQENRKEYAQFLKKKILECTLPLIVMGDMNDFNYSAPMDSLKDAGMKNAWWEGGLGYGETYHEGWLRLRIDHILYSEKLKLCGIKVVDTNLSDHNPVVAKFSVNN